jgi:hypothetical protein
MEHLSGAPLWGGGGLMALPANIGQGWKGLFVSDEEKSFYSIDKFTAIIDKCS